MLRILDDEVVDRVLDPSTALEAVGTAFELLATGGAVDHPRERTTAGGTTLNVMWAAAPSLDALTVKSYPVVRPSSGRGSVISLLLYGHATGELRALLQADLLGRRRTAAVSALASRAMARSDSTTLALLGTGYQAPAQVDALATVLPLREVVVVGRDPARAEATAEGVRTAHPALHVETCTDADSAVARADVVVLATSAVEPVFDGRALRPGTHVNAIGSNRADHRELDRTALARAARIVVDSHVTAGRECGDLLTHGLDPSDPAVTSELAAVHAGAEPGRLDADDITVFESHGLALTDLVCAVRVLAAAEAAGLGAALGPDTWSPRTDHDRSTT